MASRSLLLLGLPLAALLALGCGSSAPASQAPAPAPAAAAPTTAPATPTTPAATPTARPPEFSSIIKAATGSFKVTYNLKMTVSGQPPFTGTSTIYVKPPKTRFDSVTRVDGREMPTSMFMLEDGTYMCSEMGCLRLPRESAQAQSDPVFGLQQGLRDRPDDYITESKGTRQIAGMTAYCFAVRPRTGAAGDPSETCYSSDGIPLGIYNRSGATQSEMEATAVSRTVADDDFKLPSPAMDMPAMPAIPGMPPGAMPNVPGMPSGTMPNVPGR
jgi:hypothetical protein